MKGVAILTLFCTFWCPTLYGNQELTLSKLKDIPDQAIGEHILIQVYSHLDIELKFKVLPASRALKYAREGVVDGEIQRLIIIEKTSPTLIRVPTSIGPLDSCIFFTKKIPFTSLEDFGEYKIAYVRGIKSYEPLLKHFKESFAVNTQGQIWKMIDQGRADLTSAGRIGGLYQLRKMGISGIYPLDPPRKKYALYHYLNEKHRDLVPRVNKVLLMLSKTGELEKIRNEAIERLLNSVD